jgi:hypothetical protein
MPLSTIGFEEISEHEGLESRRVDSGYELSPRVTGMLPHSNGVKLGLGCGWLGVATFEGFGVRYGMAATQD